MARSIQRLLEFAQLSELPASADALSRQLEIAFQDRFQSRWIQAGAWATGSLAHRRLCPQSDIDLIFLGEPDVASRVVAELFEMGIKVRCKVFEPDASLLEVLDPRDRLALLSCRPLVRKNPQAESDQTRRIRAAQNELLQKPALLLRAIQQLRQERLAKVTDCIGYLEPNLKMGAGGLRDVVLLEGALSIHASINAKKKEDSIQLAQAFQQWGRELSDVADRLVAIRYQIGQVEGASDVLTAQAQFELFRAENDELTSERIQDSMQSILRDMDWVDLTLRSLLSLRQRSEQVRAHGQVGRETSDRILVNRLCLIDSDGSAQSLWDQGILAASISGFQSIKYHVSHDQYHQLCVGAHLLRALKTVEAAFVKHKTLGSSLAKVAARLSRSDWVSLMWAAVYHDVGKGSGRDHSEVSVELLKKDWDRLTETVDGFSSRLTQASRNDIVWLIENHLALSAAAFRKNVESPETWRSLHELGVKEARIDLLTVFTAVDILATNPSALTAWKERLLFELCQRLHEPATQSVAELSEWMHHHGYSKDLAYRFDPSLVVGIGAKKLVQDFEKTVQVISESRFSVRLISRTGPLRLYVRFARGADSRGLLLQCLGALKSVGLSIRHASIHTFDSQEFPIGVYNWFEVRPPGKLASHQIARLQKRLEQAANSIEVQEAVEGSRPRKPRGSPSDRTADPVQVSVITSNSNEWVLSFKGSDEVGLLFRIVKALNHQGALIRWARVHTWGKQVDDVVSIAPMREQNASDLSQLLQLDLSALS